MGREVCLQRGGGKLPKTKRKLAAPKNNRREKMLFCLRSKSNYPFINGKPVCLQSVRYSPRVGIAL